MIDRRSLRVNVIRVQEGSANYKYGRPRRIDLLNWTPNGSSAEQTVYAL